MPMMRRFPANFSLTRVKSSRGRENTLPSTLLMRAQSYLSSPGATLFLLNLALFFFCFLLKLFSSFVKLSPSWSSPHVLGLGLQRTMWKKSSPSIFLNFFTFVLRITWDLTPPFFPLFLNQNWLKISEKEHHERHAARDPRHFFLLMFFLHTLRWLRQSLCHNESWNKTCARSGVTFTWSRHTTLWIGCVAWPDQRRRDCDTLRAVPPFRHSPPRESKKKKEQKNKIKQGKKERKKLLSARYWELWEWGAPSSIFLTNFFFCIFFFFIGDGLRWKERLELLVVYNCQKDCKRIKSLHIVIYKLRCYAGISGPEKSRNNTGEKISYLFTCVDIANIICRNFIYKRPAHSMYFGLIYDPQAKEKTPLTKYTKNIFVADIRNESRIKAKQNRDVLTLTRALYSNQVLLFLTKRFSSYIYIICYQI